MCVIALDLCVSQKSYLNLPKLKTNAIIARKTDEQVLQSDGRNTSIDGEQLIKLKDDWIQLKHNPACNSSSQFLDIESFILHSESSNRFWNNLEFIIEYFSSLSSFNSFTCREQGILIPYFPGFISFSDFHFFIR